MQIGKRVPDALGLTWGVAITIAIAMGWAGVALADDVPQGSEAPGETLALEQAAVDPAILETPAGTAPEAVPGAADLAGMPGAASASNGAPALGQPSFAGSQASVTGGAVSSSILQATTTGGTVSVGQ